MRIHTPAAGDPVRRKLAAARAALAAALIERDDEVDLVLTALLAREHVLLVGPPGCGKSLLLDAVMRWVGGTTFTCLLTRFTTPEELFGPVSVAGLKEDKYRRITTGKLPEADGCFLDELFKGSSAILNTLLRLLNERVFDPGDGTPVACPLKLCVAASNEWPGSTTGGPSCRRCSTGSCCGRRSARSRPPPAGSGSSGPPATPPGCRTPSPRASSTGPTPPPWPWTGRRRRGRPWRRSSGSWRGRGSGPGTGGSSRRSRRAGRTPTWAGRIGSSRSTWRSPPTPSGTPRRSSRGRPPRWSPGWPTRR